MTQPERLDVHLMDEAPRIGSGWRIVEIISVGYKWATIRYAPLGVRAKIRRKVWDQIVESARPC